MTKRIFKHCCAEMEKRVQDENVSIEFFDKFREYGISLVGSSGIVRIKFCPWCGVKLPDSLRTRYYDELEAMGIEDPPTQGVPDEFKGSEWFIKREIS